MRSQSRLEARVAEGEAALTQALEVDQAAEADRATLTVVLKAFSLRAELEAAAATGEKLAAAEKSAGRRCGSRAQGQSKSVTRL